MTPEQGMTPEQFAQVEESFHRLAGLAEADRRPALDDLRREDPALAEEVARLLLASASTWQLSDWGGEEEEWDDEAPRGMPERIGDFRVLREIGRGGMGVVYLGQREDEFHQRVALKVVRVGMDADILGRLRRERQILATLDHPNIARLLDGGSTDDGRPYFAMEHIEGQTLVAWCDERGLGVAERIRLFLDVCAAVEYAHRNLVIHRDLKPGNILVTDSGVAKLLDFGIAKLLAPEADGRRGPLGLAHPAGGPTRTGLLPMTPDYASPEQMLGQPLTTATDVFSLGLVLFQLLTGEHPYAENLGTLGGMARFLRSTQVPKASSRVLSGAKDGSGEVRSGEVRSGPPLRPRQLAGALRGDLDNILAMALRREPERRYPSVAELAEDLRRHLDLRPVKAHPESFGYRVGRFVRRQRVWVAAGALVFVSLSAGVAGTGWQARRADEARRAAEDQAQLAGTVSDYLVEIFGEPDPGKHLGEEPRARDLLARGRERLDDLAGEPRLQATLALVIGQAYQKLGDHGEALDLYRRSLETRRGLVAPPHGDLVESLLYLADAESLEGHTEAAEHHLLEALRQQTALTDTKRIATDPEDSDQATARRATLLNDLGVNRFRRGDFASAIETLGEALALRRAQLGARHVDTAQTLSNLAAVRLAAGEIEQAVEPMSESLRIFEERLGVDHPDTLWARANLAAALYRSGREDDAIATYEQLVRSQRRVYGGGHPQLGRSLLNLGSILLRSGQTDRSVDVFDEAASILGATAEGSREHASALVGLGKARLGAGQTGPAQDAFRRALALLDTGAGTSAASAPGTDGLRISAHSGLGRALAHLGRPEEAAGSLCAAIEMRDASTTSAPEAAEPSRDAAQDLALLRKILPNAKQARADAPELEENDDWARAACARLRDRPGR